MGKPVLSTEGALNIIDDYIKHVTHLGSKIKNRNDEPFNYDEIKELIKGLENAIDVCEYLIKEDGSLNKDNLKKLTLSFTNIQNFFSLVLTAIRFEIPEYFDTEVIPKIRTQFSHIYNEFLAKHSQGAPEEQQVPPIPDRTGNSRFRVTTIDLLEPDTSPISTLAPSAPSAPSQGGVFSSRSSSNRDPNGVSSSSNEEEEENQSNSPSNQ